MAWYYTFLKFEVLLTLISQLDQEKPTRGIKQSEWKGLATIVIGSVYIYIEGRGCICWLCNLIQFYNSDLHDMTTLRGSYIGYTYTKAMCFLSMCTCRKILLRALYVEK